MLDEVTIRFILAVLVLAVGLTFLFGLYRFGLALFGSESAGFMRELREFLMHFGPDPARYQWWVDGFTTWHQNYLQKRNDFWEHYGQVALAVLIVIVLAVLLLTKVISAEAGLPILSAVAGFAIAKSSAGGGTTTRREPPNPNRG